MSTISTIFEDAIQDKRNLIEIDAMDMLEFIFQDLFRVKESLNYEKDWKKFLNHVSFKSHFSPRISNNSTVSFFSGGLESVVIARKIVCGNKTDFLYVSNVELAKKRLNLTHVEPILVAISFVLGYDTALLGLEYSPEEELIDDTDIYSKRACDEMARILNMTIIRPVATSSKFSLFNQARVEELEFMSCSENENISSNSEVYWCGECFKCFQIETFNRAIQATDSLPIDIFEMPIIRYIEEISDYASHGSRIMSNGKSNDPFSDSSSFLEALQEYAVYNSISDWNMKEIMEHMYSKEIHALKDWEKL